MKQAFILLAFFFVTFMPIKSFGINQAQNYYSEGINLVQEKKWPEAKEKFSQAIKLDPNYKTAYLKRGVVRLHLEDYDGALEDFNTAIKLDSHHIEAFNNRSLVSLQLIDAFVKRGIVWKKMGNHEEAKKDFDRAFQLDPLGSAALVHRAEMRVILEQDYDGALEDYNRFLKLHPDNKHALKNREIIKKMIQKKQIKTRNSRNPEKWFTLPKFPFFRNCLNAFKQ